VAIKVRYSDFTTITRSRTLPNRTDVTKTIYETAVSLLDGVTPLRSPLRLVGVRLESVAAAGEVAEQLVLDQPASGWREVERVADAASRRFGNAAPRPATLVVALADDVAGRAPPRAR
jgi:DNA polymerase-4